MKLITKFAKRIDSDSGYDIFKMARDLAEIAEQHYSDQLSVGVVRKSFSKLEEGENLSFTGTVINNQLVLTIDN